jgi:hypothetical protein
MKKIALAGVLAALFAAPLAFAESDVNTAAGPTTSAAAKLDFEVVIPRVLFLQVGTGTVQSDNTTVDKITFTVPASDLGDPLLPVAGTGGDLTGGKVSVRLFGNGGNITLTAASPSGADLVNAAGDSIPWTEVAVATAVGATTGGFSATAIAHPTINSATGVVVTATNKVIRQSGTWTYSYKNTTAYAEGTYGGTNVRNGRVTYTAAMP